jgi:glutaredoxin-like protein NrdH
MIVYTKPNCRGCIATKRKLDDLGAKYEVREMDSEAIALAQSNNILQAPIVVVGNVVFGGYSPDRLKQYAVV